MTATRVRDTITRSVLCSSLPPESYSSSLPFSFQISAKIKGNICVCLDSGACVSVCVLVLGCAETLCSDKKEKHCYAPSLSSVPQKKGLLSRHPIHTHTRVHCLSFRKLSFSPSAISKILLFPVFLFVSLSEAVYNLKTGFAVRLRKEKEKKTLNT